MKTYRIFWLLSLVILITAEAGYSQTKFPQPVGYVNDFAGVIPESYKQQMTRIALEVEQKTGAEIAVVTVETVGDEHYSDYANKLFEAWGIGKKGKDNGVLIFNTIKERRVWIEVGYGLEGILPDGLVGEVLDQYVVPHLREGNYGEGLLGGVQAVAGVIAKDAGVEITGSVKISERDRSQGRPFGLLPFFIVLILWLLFSRRGRRHRSIMGPWFWGGFGGGGFGSGGSFGGGFGGFGGGMSGGGGAGRGY
ncbi:MAG: TPM domain-containing protein [candidate division KSB1 bacterium]|nr:TPM domain-containing protein [candidate division KSB1 bacterium]